MGFQLPFFVGWLSSGAKEVMDFARPSLRSAPFDPLSLFRIPVAALGDTEQQGVRPRLGGLLSCPVADYAQR